MLHAKNDKEMQAAPQTQPAGRSVGGRAKAVRVSLQICFRGGYFSCSIFFVLYYLGLFCSSQLG